MEEIIQFLAGILNREFIRAVFSNPRVKGNVVKAKLRPVEQDADHLLRDVSDALWAGAFA